MDKGNPKRANGVLTCGNEDIPLDFGPKQLVGGGKGERKRRKKKEEKRKEEGEERSSTFSLVFLAIGPSVSVGARGKVRPHGKSFK